METTTPFNLNRAIQNWRSQLAQSPAFRSENLNELESHLRDSIATLQTRGLSVEEAFSISEKRIGRAKGLEIEFSKVNTPAVWLDRILWILIGIQVWGLVSNIVNSLTRNALIFGLSNMDHSIQNISLALPTTLFILTKVLAVASSIALCWWLIAGKGQRVGKWFGSLLKERSSLVALAAVLSVVWLVAYAIASAGNVLWARTLSPSQLGKIYAGFSVSALVLGPLQIVGMIVLTLVLARKRLYASRT